MRTLALDACKSSWCRPLACPDARRPEACTWLPQGEPLYGKLVLLARLGLTRTLFLIGLQLSREALRTVGWRALVQGVILWVVISFAGLLAVGRWVG